MDSDKLRDELFLPFSYNSAVGVKSEDLAAKYGFNVGAVVGLMYVDAPEMAAKLNVPIGTRLLDIEGPKGNTVTIPYDDLELIEP